MTGCDALRISTAQGSVTVQATGTFGAVLVQVSNEPTGQVTGAVLSYGQALTLAVWLALGGGYVPSPDPSGEGETAREAAS